MSESKVELSSKMKKADLLALPVRNWNADTYWWRALLIVPTRFKHDSGFAQIAIIGVEGDSARQILGYPDDIRFPTESAIGPNMPDYGSLNMDAYYPSGVLRLWSNTYDFAVTQPVSSVDIQIRPRLRTANN